CTRIRPRKIRVLLVFIQVFALFGDAQVFFSLRKVGMKTQRLFELQDRLREVAFAHENLTQVVMWLSKFRVEIAGLLKMVLCFGQLALLKNQTSQVDMRIDQTGIELQRLAIVRNCFLEFAAFFQERAVTVVRLRGLGGQSNRGFGFDSRLVVVTKLLQKISVAGVILGIIGLNAQRLFKMGLRLVQFSFLHYQRGQINVGFR